LLVVDRRNHGACRARGLAAAGVCPSPASPHVRRPTVPAGKTCPFRVSVRVILLKRVMDDGDDGNGRDGVRRTTKLAGLRRRQTLGNVHRSPLLCFLYFLFPPLHNSCHGFSIRIMYGTEGILIWCSLARKQKLGDHLTRTVHLTIFPMESFLHTYIRMSQLASPTMWRTSTPNNHIIATVLGTRTPGPGSHVLRKWMTQRKAANRVSAAPSSTLPATSFRAPHGSAIPTRVGNGRNGYTLYIYAAAPRSQPSTKQQQYSACEKGSHQYADV
jgi:hypothetical protein